MRQLLLIFVTILPMHAFAQDDDHGAFVVLSDPSLLLLGGADVSRYNVVDTANLVLKFEHLSKQDTTDTTYRRDVTVLEIGDKWVKYYSFGTYVDNLSLTSYWKQTPYPPGLQNYRINDLGVRFINYEILTEQKNEHRKINHFIPIVRDQVMQYTELSDQLNWEILAEQQEICNYQCQKAMAHYKGRIWYAWFTPAIPVNYGPWKLNGLPGAVLMARDSQNQFIITCLEIKSDKAPIKDYIWNNVTKCSKNKYNKSERQWHQSPLLIFGDGGNRTMKYMVSREPYRSVVFDSSWTIPYNPIERE